MNRKIILIAFLPFICGLSSCQKEEHEPSRDVATRLVLNNYVSIYDSDCLMKIYDLKIENNVFSFKVNIITDYYDAERFGDSWYKFFQISAVFEDISSISCEVDYTENSFTDVDALIELNFGDIIKFEMPYVIYFTSNIYGSMFYEGGELND